MRRLVLALALLALAPASAFAQEQRLIAQYTEAGDPELRVFPSFGETPVPEVRRCPPGGVVCTPMPAPNAEHVYLAGETAAGTVFEADVKNAEGVVSTVRTVPWQGRVTATAPPTIAGDAKVGGTVTVADGTWSGGWGDRPGWSPQHPVQERTYTTVIACRTPDRTDCWSPLAGPLAQRWGGWYLFAASTRFDGDMTGRPIPVQAFWPFPSPADARALPTRAYSAPVQICCTLAAPAVGKVTLRKRAVRGGGKITVGRVTCSDPCHVALRVGGRVTRFTAEGTRALRAPARKGKLRVRVYLDGELVKTGTVRA